MTKVGVGELAEWRSLRGGRAVACDVEPLPGHQGSLGGIA